MGCLKLEHVDKGYLKKINFSLQSAVKRKGNSNFFRLNTSPFGFNGMEGDDEVKGVGNSYTTQFRQYDPRLGRWKSLDPLMAIQPFQSPYQAFNNNPIFFTDPLGLIGGPAREKFRLDYSVDQKFNDSDFDKLLPMSGINGDMFFFKFTGATKPEDRTSLSYQYEANNKRWRKTTYIKGSKRSSIDYTAGNTNDLSAVEEYMGEPTLVSYGGVGGSSSTYNGGGKTPSGVTMGSSTPATELMGTNPTKNSPTPNGLVPENLSDVKKGTALTAKMVSTSATLTGIEIADDISKVESLGGKTTNLAGQVKTLEKIAKSAKVLANVVAVYTITDNITKAYNADNTYDKVKYTTKSVVAAFALGMTMSGVGAPIGAAIFVIATAVEWFW